MIVKYPVIRELSNWITLLQASFTQVLRLLDSDQIERRPSQK
jgi:hypothetical protein